MKYFEETKIIRFPSKAQVGWSDVTFKKKKQLESHWDLNKGIKARPWDWNKCILVARIKK